MASITFLLLIIVIVKVSWVSEVESSRLKQDFYKSTCPRAEAIVFEVVKKAVLMEPRMAASLLRLHFHDCFVNGCDASILLDDTPTFTGEKTAPPNLNSARGFHVIDEIKAALESYCPHTVSCADIIAIAARDGVVLSGGPCWQPLLGRRDSFTANKAAATHSIPPPTASVSTLIHKFAAVGLSAEDMVTLSGSHTLGKAHCVTFRDRLRRHEAKAVRELHGQGEFLASLEAVCADNNTLTVLDVETPTKFDNQYFRNLVNGAGLLTSDESLFSSPGLTRDLVNYYAHDEGAFFEKFKMAMLKMGNIKPLTSEEGEIRTTCRHAN